MILSRRSRVPFSSPSALSALAITMSLALVPSCKDKPAETTAVDAAAAVDAAVATKTVATDASADDASTTAAADAAAPDHEGKRGGHGGPSLMLFQAARALDLKDDQKAKVDAAEKTAHAGMDEAARDAMKAASKDLHAELVLGIKAGKIDNAKLEPKYAALEKLTAASHAKEAEALTALHDALDATQRKAVTASVRAKQAAREAKMAHRGGHDGGAPDGGAAHFQTKRTLGGLTRGLELDAEQEKKVDALVAKDDGKGHPDPAEMKKHVEALLTAFEADKLDAKKLDAFDAKKARGPMEAETKLLTQLLPILKPEQREKLAARMEKGPSPHGRRGGFGNPPVLEQQPDEDD
jgi:Spy/CpxP family protein refolding chaperone